VEFSFNSFIEIAGFIFEEFGLSNFHAKSLFKLFVVITNPQHWLALYIETIALQ